ncbi:MAG TPA: hypothetical protein VLS89_16950, partial [Candidatus Nanopelagicales bacterium]|nr:hypothetical protein [Candidatus Nanopelagicales bacterium]
MGQPEQFAKRTFAEDTERLTGGGAVWEDPPEIQLGPVQGDGLLIVRHAEALTRLPPPWPQALGGDEVLVEIKMGGDHLDVPSIERALLRRQGRRVQRVEAAAAEGAPWPPQEALWLVAPHVPTWLHKEYEVTPISPGCFRVGPAQFPFLWIAANGLPLADELVPFLVARS